MKFGEDSINISEGVKLSGEYTVEIGVAQGGAITDVRVTNGYFRYGPPAAWRRYFSRWFPWLLIHFHRAQPPSVFYTHE